MHGVSAGPRSGLIALVAALLLLAPACSLVTVGYPPARDPGLRPVACTKSRIAPVVDVLIAGALAATLATGEVGGPSGPLPIASGFFLFSAASGIRDTGRCRTLARRTPPEIVIASEDRGSDALPSVRADIPTTPIDARATPPLLEEQVPIRVPKEPAPPPRRFVRLPDETVVRALNQLQSAFVACFKRAHRANPMLGPVRVKVRLELDPAGMVVVAANDAIDTKLSRCISMVAKQLPFPVPGAPAAVDFPLFFNAGS